MRVTGGGFGGFQFGEFLADDVGIAERGAKDGVNETGLVLVTQGLGGLDGRMNGGMGRDAVEEEYLVKPKSQENLDDGLLRALLRLPVNQPIQRALPADAAIDKFLTKPAIIGVKPGAIQGTIKVFLHESTLGKAVEQDMGGDFTGGVSEHTHNKCFSSVRGEPKMRPHARRI